MINKQLLKKASIKKAYIPAALLQSIFITIFTITNAYLLAVSINGVFIKKQSLQDIELYILLFMLNSLVKFIFNFVVDFLIKRLSSDLKENIKSNTFKLIMDSNPYKVNERNTGELINALTEGTEMLTPYFSQYIPQLFESILIPALICVFVFFMDRLSALIMLITYPVIPLFMHLIGYKSKEINEGQWKKLTMLSSHFLDVLQGLRTLKVFGRSRIQEEKVYKVSESYRRSTIEVLKVSFLSALVLELSATICTAVIAVNLGIRLVYNKIDFFTAFFVLIIAPEFYIPLRQLGVKYHISLNGQVAIEKINAFEDSLKTKVPLLEELKQIKSVSSIEVRNLKFSYCDRESLNYINFEIKPHEKIALIGGSGSGKSTLLNILSGFLQPDNNMVFINSIDINHLDKVNYSNKIAVVPQFPHIFNMSIKDNITLGNLVSENDFINICRITRVSDFAEKFKDKYKTLIGDGEDISISGGEKQRIALARALVKNSEIIILDEPTSSLDTETEELLFDAISNYLNDKIVLIAAHRLKTVKAADKIMVLENGTLIEMGSHQELIETKGKYYSLLQISGVEL